MAGGARLAAGWRVGHGWPLGGGSWLGGGSLMGGAARGSQTLMMWGEVQWVEGTVFYA